MTINGVKLGYTVTFMKSFASLVSLIFLPKSLTWNKIAFPVSNLLNFADVVENNLMKSISKKFTNIPFCIRFMAACCKYVKSL